MKASADLYSRPDGCCHSSRQHTKTHDSPARASDVNTQGDRVMYEGRWVMAATSDRLHGGEQKGSPNRKHFFPTDFFFLRRFVKSE